MGQTAFTSLSLYLGLSPLYWNVSRCVRKFQFGISAYLSIRCLFYSAGALTRRTRERDEKQREKHKLTQKIFLKAATNRGQPLSGAPAKQTKRTARNARSSLARPKGAAGRRRTQSKQLQQNNTRRSRRLCRSDPLGRDRSL